VTEPLPPVALAISFIDHINRRDLASLSGLMSSDHRLEVFDEDPLVGKDFNIDAWRGYFASFPRYVIYPHRISQRSGCVAILGHTTGSHLGLPENEKRKLTLIWLAQTANGSITRWKLVEDTHSNRRVWGLDTI
jgi:ketosteroid isomerase-like protein